jgi:AraC family transcriptional regulator of adaptative response / methylphosphotriester-DNA alkyltransferase methyltransferase
MSARRSRGTMRAHTFIERRRLYLYARTIVKRHYQRPLTLDIVAKALASSPRQLQRAYAQFGERTFREDLLATRIAAAARLLSQPATMPVGEVARLVGYSQPSHFARTFRSSHGVSPAAFRADRQAARREAPQHASVPAGAGVLKH